MKLFDDIPRNHNGPAHFAQPTFDYLNRSSRPEFERIRNLLEQWFEHIPPEVQRELRSRFRDKNDRQHASAFFELYLHELLLQLGFDTQFHPRREGERRHPDFMVLKGGERLFYLEATLAALSDTEAAAKARENQVYDALNKMASPNFFIGLKVCHASETPVPVRKMRRSLEAWLAGLDPDQVAKQIEDGGFQAWPFWNWGYEGWQITFYAIPKPPSDRGKPGVRPIGALMPTEEPTPLTPHIRIRRSIEDKASKYGKLDLPYVVAINLVDEWGANDTAIRNALFGDEKVRLVFRGADLIQQIPWRKRNGAWYGPGGPHNKRVSAALIAVDLYPWTIAKVIPVLWHNPWANYIVRKDVWSLPQRVPDKGNQLVKRDGKSGWELLGLYPNWPNTCEDAQAFA